MKKFHGGYNFFGHEVSEYGKKYNRVDYATFAKSFNAVLNNEILTFVTKAGYYFELVSGYTDWEYEIEQLQNELDELPCDCMEYKKIMVQIEELEEQKNCYGDAEVFQWYIIDDFGASQLEYWLPNEIVYYCEELDMYLWGVAHFGTAWSYILTDIVIAKDNESEEV